MKTRQTAGAVVSIVMGLTVASGACASTLLSDNFDAEPLPAGNFVLNYNSFANFFVADGTVDLLGTPNGFGLPGTGGFVDLDGTSNDAGYIETIQQFSFNAGDVLTLSFSAAGNQRGAGPDTLFGGFRFFMPASVGAVTFTGFDAIQTPAPLLIGSRAVLADNQGYTPFSVSFRALSAGSVSALIGTSGTDNQGPLLDNFLLSRAVPEPTTWALMLIGFGGLGAAMRRRRAALSI